MKLKVKMPPLVLAAIFSFTLLFPLVYAQQIIGTAGTNLRPWVEFIVGRTDWPDEFMLWPNIVYYLILPFMAIVAVVYGIMTDLRIFTNQYVKIVLSVAMTGMTLPSGILITAVMTLYSIGASFAAIAFGVVFIVGVIFWAAGRFMFFGYGIKGQAEYGKQNAKLLKGIDQELGHIRRRLLDLQVKQRNSGLGTGEENELRRLQARETELSTRRRAMREEL
jgi:hypothetical protein